MTKRSMLPSSMHTPWAESKSYNLSELNTIQGGVASPCLSSSLPFCVRFNRALPLEIQLYSQAATLDTKPLAKSYLDGSHSHLPSNHFQYARAFFCYPDFGTSVRPPLWSNIFLYCIVRVFGQSANAAMNSSGGR